ncbi:MAG: hypothetical protein KBT02_04040 [Treponema sp.]|nr:hypothetical protein [Candidatus Treponema caballi]
MSKKKIIRIAIIAVAAVLILAGCALFIWNRYFDPYRGTVSGFENSLPLETELTVEQAQRDIAFVYATLAERHPMWLEDNSPRVEDVKDLYVDALADLSLDEDGMVTALDVWRAVSKMTAALGDGHTSVWWQNPDMRFIDNLILYETGGRPAAVNGVPIEDVLEQFRLYSSFETEATFLSGVFNTKLIRKHFLDLIGIDTSSGVRFTCRKDDGTLYDCWYTFVTADNVLMAADAEENGDGSWVYFNIDQDADLGVFTLKECNWNDEYQKTLKTFFDEVAASGVKSVAVDLRGNGGGNSQVANEFIRYLPVDGYESWWCDIRYGPFLKQFHNAHHKNKNAAPVFNGNVYVLTDVNTYSAAMDFAMLVKDNALGSVVGEASGNQPGSYGDCLYFQLPESRLALSVSFKKWYRVDQTKNGQLIEPDYPCAPDTALDEVKRIIAARR